MYVFDGWGVVRVAFQCSSASRKFLNGDGDTGQSVSRLCFSALQRAENSSILRRRRPPDIPCRFQCSSASRKFLNSLFALRQGPNTPVSVLFSEPKIPQLSARVASPLSRSCFSALQRAENSSMVE